MHRVISCVLAVALVLMGLPCAYATPSLLNVFALGRPSSVNIASFETMATRSIDSQGNVSGGNYNTRHFSGTGTVETDGYFVPSDSVAMLQSIFQTSGKNYFNYLARSSNAYCTITYKIPSQYKDYKGNLIFHADAMESAIIQALAVDCPDRTLEVLESIFPSTTVHGRWILADSAAPSVALQTLSSQSLSDFSVEVDFTQYELSGDLCLTYYFTVDNFKVERKNVSSQYRLNKYLGILPAISALPINGGFTFPDTDSSSVYSVEIWNSSDIDWKSGYVPGTSVLFGPFDLTLEGYPGKVPETSNNFNNSPWWYGYGNGYPSSYSSYWSSGYCYSSSGLNAIPSNYSYVDNLTLGTDYYLLYCIPIDFVGLDYSSPFVLSTSGLLDFNSGVDIINAAIVRDSMTGDSDSTNDANQGPFGGRNTYYVKESVVSNKISYSEIELFLTDILPIYNSGYKSYTLSGAGVENFEVSGLEFQPSYFCIKVPNSSPLSLGIDDVSLPGVSYDNKTVFPVALNSVFTGSISYLVNKKPGPSVTDPDSILGKLDSIIELLQQNIGCMCKDVLSEISLKIDDIKEMLEKITGSVYDREMMEDAENSDVKPPSSSPGSLFNIFKVLSGFFGGNFQFNFDWFSWASDARDFIVNSFGFQNSFSVAPVPTDGR